MYSVLTTLFQYTYFTCQKALLHTFLLLVSKIVESLQCILKNDINKKLVSVAWHPTRWWDWCMSEDKKKDPVFTDKVEKCQKSSEKIKILLVHNCII